MENDDDSDLEDAMFEQTIKMIRKLESKKSELKCDKKMSSRFAELGKHYLDRQMSINFHDGFRDLNPHYHQMRR